MKMMMIMVCVLVAAAAYVYEAPSRKDKDNGIKEIKETLDRLLKNLPEDTLNVMVMDLFKNGSSDCKTEVFCQAEKELSKVSDLKDEGLIRKMKAYLKHKNMEKCPNHSHSVEISLHMFLKQLKMCAQKIFSNPTKHP